jgi:uncharacterized membrane protein
MSQENPFETASASQVDPKIIAIVSYMALIGWIVAIVLNNPKSELGSFHLRQALGIHALSALAGMVAIVPVLGWIAAAVGGIGAFILWVIGLIGAIEGKMKPVPILGEKFQEWFHAI